MTRTSEKTSLGVSNLLGSKLALPKLRVLKVLTFNNCYAILMLSHDPSQNLGADRCPPLVCVAVPYIAKEEVP